MDTSILAWFQIANLVSTLPTEHKNQTATYKEQMQCLAEKHCYTVLDTLDNTWIIRKREPITIPSKEQNYSDSQNQEINDDKNIEK